MSGAKNSPDNSQRKKPAPGERDRQRPDEAQVCRRKMPRPDKVNHRSISDDEDE